MSYEHSGDIVPSVPNAGCICARCEYLREIPGTGADHIGVYKPDVLDATNAGCSCVRCERLRRSVAAAPPPREGEGEGLPMGDETLKPCPFCGGPAEFLQMTVSMWRARCASRDTCHVAPSAPASFAKSATAQLWNRRADEASIRAEAAADQTAAVCAKLRSWGRCARNGGPDEPRAVWYFDVAQELEELAAAGAFPKPGSAEAARPQIVTAPSSSAPIPPGGDRPEECPCCFSEDTPEGADCFCPDWCPEQCEGGEVHHG